AQILKIATLYYTSGEISAVIPKLNTIPDGAIKLMRTRIGLLAQPKSMRSIIDATRREQRYG
ncbi:MAG: hypothetical protein ACKVIU_08685, partial [Rhodobacterales bacterium]